MAKKPEMKKCTICGKEYPATLEFFTPSKQTKSGWDPRCKACRRQQEKERYHNSPGYKERKKKNYKDRYDKEPGFKEHRLEYAKERYANEPEFREGMRQRYLERRDNEPEFREMRNARQRESWASNPEARARHMKLRKKRFAENPDLVDKQRDYLREWGKEHYRSDPRRRLSSLMARAIRRAIKQQKGGRSWEVLVGYTLEDLMAHLESKFQKGMTWENMGQWHIDHIRPISSFHFETPDDPEFRQCWSLSNLQPLWGKDNLSKGAKYNPH